ncbi:hypothetical protein F2Q70_00013441 [Brassica cretica]|uniref:F-box associated beta-propeller type 3 domain-containing protein n=1 Tax=Brassica cretica TaxID=69181 RepID=A0A8S9M8G7_BRACR|nr:hypothetical protein F2Q68_00006455 [Brassica cretica]KAF2614747.1 hypothetical protein F2Q70_00013441 [Brassica cretica]
MMRDDSPPALASYHRMLNRSPVAYRPNISQQQLQHTPREYNQYKPLALILGLRSSSLLQQNALDLERKEWSKYVYTLPVNGICEVFVVGVTTTSEIVLSEKVTSTPFYVFYFSPERNTLQRVEI